MLEKSKKIEKAVSLLSFDSKDLLNNLSVDERKQLLANCHTIFTNPAFTSICNEVYTKEILSTISDSHSLEMLAEGRGRIMGVAAVMDLIKDYHLQYLDSLKKEESMSNDDKQEII